MRRWGFSLVGFLLLAMPARGADISREQALYFRGFDNLSAGATNERVKGPEAALEYYLKARECFKQVLEEYPNYSSVQVRRKLAEVDAKLRPMLLAQGMVPEIYLKPPRNAPPRVVQTPPTHRVPTLPPARPAGITPVRPPAQQATRQSYEQILAQTRARIQERDLQNQRKLADYEDKLREAMAARPKSLEPGELAKQLRANESLKKEYDFLKNENRKGEGTLLQALGELEKLQKDNAYLQQRLAQAGSPRQMQLLNEENKSLRRQITELQRIVSGRVGMGTLQTQLAKERQRARELEAENEKLRQILTNPQRP